MRKTKCRGGSRPRRQTSGMTRHFLVSRNMTHHLFNTRRTASTICPPYSADCTCNQKQKDTHHHITSPHPSHHHHHHHGLSRPLSQAGPRLPALLLPIRPARRKPPPRRRRRRRLRSQQNRPSPMHAHTNPANATRQPLTRRRPSSASQARPTSRATKTPCQVLPLATGARAPRSSTRG